MLRYDENGALYFVCLKCGTITRLYGVKKFIKSLNFKGSDKSGHKVSMEIDATPFIVKCPTCLEEYDEFGDDSLLFNVDPDIAKDILILNMKGYDTHFSCSSHCDVGGTVHECDNDFYCMLDFHDGDINQGNIPEGFVAELIEPLDDEGWSKYVIRRDLFTYREKYSDELIPSEDGYYIPYKVWKKEQDITLKNFKKWVFNLPDLNCSDEELESEINYIDIHISNDK